MKYFLLVLTLLVMGISACHNTRPETKSPANTPTGIADEFIIAFYSFDSNQLEKVLSNAQESKASIMYYQKWAECGNYAILTCITRPKNGLHSTGRNWSKNRARAYLKMALRPVNV